MAIHDPNSPANRFTAGLSGVLSSYPMHDTTADDAVART